MVSASVEFITTRRAVKAAAVEIDAQQLIAHLQSRFGGQVSHGHQSIDSCLQWPACRRTGG